MARTKNKRKRKPIKRRDRGKGIIKQPLNPDVESLLISFMVKAHMNEHKKLGMTEQMALDDLEKLGYITGPSNRR